MYLRMYAPCTYSFISLYVQRTTYNDRHNLTTQLREDVAEDVYCISDSNVNRIQIQKNTFAAVHQIMRLWDWDYKRKNGEIGHYDNDYCRIFWMESIQICRYLHWHSYEIWKPPWKSIIIQFNMREQIIYNRLNCFCWLNGDLITRICLWILHRWIGIHI